MINKRWENRLISFALALIILVSPFSNLVAFASDGGYELAENKELFIEMTNRELLDEAREWTILNNDEYDFKMALSLVASGENLEDVKSKTMSYKSNFGYSNKAENTIINYIFGEEMPYLEDVKNYDFNRIIESDNDARATIYSAIALDLLDEEYDDELLEIRLSNAIYAGKINNKYLGDAISLLESKYADIDGESIIISNIGDRTFLGNIDEQASYMSSMLNLGMEDSEIYKIMYQELLKCRREDSKGYSTTPNNAWIQYEAESRALEVYVTREYGDTIYNLAKKSKDSGLTEKPFEDKTKASEIKLYFPGDEDYVEVEAGNKQIVLYKVYNGLGEEIKGEKVIFESSDPDFKFLDSNTFEAGAVEEDKLVTVTAYLESDESIKSEINLKIIAKKTVEEYDKDFEYKEVDGEIVITGYKNDSPIEDLVIPETIDGKAVRKVDNQAFRKTSFGGVKTEIKSLTLPEGLKVIGEEAFQGHKIEEIKLPNSLEIVFGRAFYNNELKTIDFHRNTEFKGKEHFSSNKLEKLRIPGSLEKINIGMFERNPLNTLEIEEGVKEIEAKAFHFSNIDEVRLPNSIEKMPKEGQANQIFRMNKIDGKLSFVKVFTDNEKVTAENTFGIINPVEVKISYIDENGEEIRKPDLVVGRELKKVEKDGSKYSISKEVGDGSYIEDYFAPVNNYQIGDLIGELEENYFRIGQEYEFEGPEINGIKPESKLVKLEKPKEEVVFIYTGKDPKDPEVDNDEIVIKNAEELIKFTMSYDNKSKEDKNKTYVLGDDIDLDESEYLILRTINSFEGKFDGRGYRIKNLKKTGKNFLNEGIFREIKEGAVVKNLIIEDAKYGVGKNSVYKETGILAKENRGLIENVRFINPIISSSESLNLGLVVLENYGKMDKISVQNGTMMFDGFLGSPGTYGILAYKNKGTIQNSYAIGQIGKKVKSGSFVGLAEENSIIKNSYSAIETGGNGFIVEYKMGAEFENVFFDKSLGKDLKIEGLIGVTKDQLSSEAILKELGGCFRVDKNFNDGYPYLLDEYSDNEDPNIDGVAKVEIDNDLKNLKEGESKTLKARVFNQDGEELIGHDLIWKVDSDKIILKDGKILAKEVLVGAKLKVNVKGTEIKDEIVLNITPSLKSIEVETAIVYFNSQGQWEVEIAPKTINVDRNKKGKFTVYDALLKTTKDIEGNEKNIKSINGISGPEDSGGWEFSVNGLYGEKNLGQEELKDGDRILWVCTYNSKKDSKPSWKDIETRVAEEGKFIVDEKEGRIIGYKGNVPSKLLIPGKINGVDIKIVGTKGLDGVFLGSGIEELIISEGIEIIEQREFFDNNIKKLELPESLKLIRGGAFKRNNIRELELPRDLEELRAAAFEENEIETLAINKKLNKIGDSAFAHNEMEYLVIPENIKEVGSSAFASNPINNLDLGRVEKIGNSAFHKTDLIDLELPNTVKEIGMSAFANSLIEDILIPKSVEKMNFDAFYSHRINNYARVYLEDLENPHKFTVSEGVLLNPLELTVRALNEEGETIDSQVIMGQKKDRNYITDYSKEHNKKDFFQVGEKTIIKAKNLEGYISPKYVEREFKKVKEEIDFIYKKGNNKALIEVAMADYREGSFIRSGEVYKLELEKENITVMDVLNELSKIGLKITTTDSSYGKSLTEIGDLKSVNSNYLMFNINDQEAPMGIEGQEVYNGDKLMFFIGNMSNNYKGPRWSDIVEDDTVQENISIEINIPKLAKVGDVLDLNAIVFEGDKEIDKEVFWLVTNPEIAKIRDDGRLEILRDGELRLIVSLKEDKTIKAEQIIRIIIKDKTPDLIVSAIKKDLERKNSFTFREALGYYGSSKDLESDILFIKDKLELRDASSANNMATNIINLIVAGENPYNYQGKNYIQELLETQQEDGKFIVNDKDDYASTQAFAIIALDMANTEYDKKAVEALTRYQESNGAYSSWGDLDTIGMVYSAFGNHLDNSEVKVSIDKSKDYLIEGLKERKANEWTYSSVIQGLIAIESEDIIDEFKLVDRLMNFINEKNIFKNDSANEQGLLALVDYVNGESIYKKIKFRQESPISIIYESNKAKNGSDLKVKINAKNNLEEDKDITLIVGLYNKEDNRLMNYSLVRQKLRGGNDLELEAGFSVPENGKYYSKAFVWNTLDQQESLTEPLIIDIAN